MKIIVADDEQDMRDYFSKILPHLGHEVLAVAGDGKSLVESCRKSSPDLIITDMMMPELNGDIALQEIWQQQAVPAIIISAYQCPEWLESKTGIPVVRYLNKPINRTQLRDALKTFEDSDSAGNHPAQK
ncbi:response regulator [Bremerella sp. P1]|uniref:response regulator n=1 Tax=Bremerella sp. P1 TaxID=3026424 RepID=UPI002368AEBF|nr:response regulator [Bremerella sp. P1]WDI40578.1 response regulator [Bremerella sp. P1]